MRHVIFALVAAVLFGTTGSAQALAPAGAESLSVGSARIVIGGAALALIALVMLQRSRTALRSGPRPTSRRAWPVVLIGAAAIIGYQPAFFLGTSINGVAIGTVVAIGSGPILTGLFEWALTRRSPGVGWFIATGVAVAGIVLLSGLGESGIVTTDATGLAFSLAAGACFAIYALAAKQLLLDGWTPTGSVALIFGWSAVGALPLLLATDLRWTLEPTGLAVALWLGLVTITIATLFLGNSLARLRASTATTLGLAEPVTAALLGVLVLHEVLSGRALIGLALVGAGLALMAAIGRRRTRLDIDATSTSSVSV